MKVTIYPNDPLGNLRKKRVADQSVSRKFPSKETNSFSMKIDDKLFNKTNCEHRSSIHSNSTHFLAGLSDAASAMGV